MRLCPANIFVQDLKDDHDWFKWFSTKIPLNNLHQRYLQLYIGFSNTNMTVWKLYVIIQNRGVSFGSIPSNESKGIIEPRWP